MDAERVNTFFEARWTGSATRTSFSVPVAKQLGKPREWQPLVKAAVVVIAVAGTGYALTALVGSEAAQALVIASTTLIFGAFFGGIVKYLIDDAQAQRLGREKQVERDRERRSEQARFVNAVLADLKAVYDRVDRVRILVAAHQSASTYGSEMRDLINSAVQLRNVIRALDGTVNIERSRLGRLQKDVAQMLGYLDGLIDEFRASYKPIADEQRIYEARFNEMLRHPDRVSAAPENKPWSKIEELPRLREFRGAGPLHDDRPADYSREFEGPLDHATRILRAELAALLGQPAARLRPAGDAADRLPDVRGADQVAG